MRARPYTRKEKIGSRRRLSARATRSTTEHAHVRVPDSKKTHVYEERGHFNYMLSIYTRMRVHMVRNASSARM